MAKTFSPRRVFCECEGGRPCEGGNRKSKEQRKRPDEKIPHQKIKQSAD